MAALLLNLGLEAKSLLPGFHFLCAKCVCLAGARPVFLDVRPDTLNIDDIDIDKPSPVHEGHFHPRCRLRNDTVCRSRAGMRSQWSKITHIGLYGKYRGRFLGTFGELATLSFHETKNFSCGEGGLPINDWRSLTSAPNSGKREPIEVDFPARWTDTWVDIG